MKMPRLTPTIENINDLYDIDAAKVGDMFYVVYETANFLTRQKEVKIFDGEEWYKYNKPMRDYMVECYTIIGVIDHIFDGDEPSIRNILDIEDLEKWVFVKDSKGEVRRTYYDGRFPTFNNKEAAERSIEMRKAEDRRIDLS